MLEPGRVLAVSPEPSRAPESIAGAPESGGPESPDPTPRPGRRAWRTLLRLAVVGLLIAGVSYAAAGQWPQVSPLLRELSWQALGLAAGSVFAGILATALAWRAIMADLGHPLPGPAMMRVFFVSQLAKYLPGKLWPVMAQMRLGRAYQIPLSASGAGAFVFLLIVLGSGLAVAVTVLPLLGSKVVQAYAWAPLALLAVVVIGSPPVLNRLLGLALRLVRGQRLPRPMSARGIAAAMGWSGLAWIAYGVQIWALARDLGAENSLWLYAVATGGFAAAFCVGVLLPLAPAGAGAREVAMVLLLGVALPQAQVIVVAVISRLLFTVLDAVWAGIGVLAVRFAGVRAAPPTPSSKGKAG